MPLDPPLMLSVSKYSTWAVESSASPEILPSEVGKLLLRRVLSCGAIGNCVSEKPTGFVLLPDHVALNNWSLDMSVARCCFESGAIAPFFVIGFPNWVCPPEPTVVVVVWV